MTARPIPAHANMLADMQKPIARLDPTMRAYIALAEALIANEQAAQAAPHPTHKMDIGWGIVNVMRRVSWELCLHNPAQVRTYLHMHDPGAAHEGAVLQRAGKIFAAYVTDREPDAATRNRLLAGPPAPRR